MTIRCQDFAIIHTLILLHVFQFGLLGFEIFGSDLDIRCGLVGIGNRSNREVGTRMPKPRNRILNYDC